MRKVFTPRLLTLVESRNTATPALPADARASYRRSVIAERNGASEIGEAHYSKFRYLASQLDAETRTAVYKANWRFDSTHTVTNMGRCGEVL